MTKISEAIKYYESIIKQVGVVTTPKSEFKPRCDRLYDCLRTYDEKMIAKPISQEKKLHDIYLGEPNAAAKCGTLTLIQEAIGDVDLSEEYLEVFMSSLKFPFKTPYERKLQKISLIYGLTKDIEITPEDFYTLIDLYHSGAYSLMFEQIILLLGIGKDLKSGLKIIISEALKYSLEESKKLEYLKEEYSKEFIEKIQQVVREECIPSDKVLEILPCKSFIDASVVEVPGLGYTIVSGEDIVLRRLKYIRVEDDYQKTLPDAKIALGFSSTGDIVYTSFTKGEYEEDLKSGKKLIRKK